MSRIQWCHLWWDLYWSETIEAEAQRKNSHSVLRKISNWILLARCKISVELKEGSLNCSTIQQSSNHRRWTKRPANKVHAGCKQEAEVVKTDSEMRFTNTGRPRKERRLTQTSPKQEKHTCRISSSSLRPSLTTCKTLRRTTFTRAARGPCSSLLKLRIKAVSSFWNRVISDPQYARLHLEQSRVRDNHLTMAQNQARRMLASSGWVTRKSKQVDHLSSKWKAHLILPSVTKL